METYYHIIAVSLFGLVMALYIVSIGIAWLAED